MKISLRWLNDYIDVEDYFEKPELLAQLLTHKGLEVESVENMAKQYDHVVIGHILEKNQHPDADKLSVCQVTTGQGVVHQIVCGAKNHKAGDRVVASLPGAVLPGNFEIKKSKIRGVESAGMLCSEVELGIAKESAGIMILPAEATIGQTFADYYGLNDVIFDIKVTANRADCLSHYGLAREIATLLGREVGVDFDNINTGGANTQDIIKLEVLEKDDCPRYAGRIIRGVMVGESPQWLKRRLESVGMNSINNVVDVTNFVMLEMGQPLHAFDIRHLKGNKVTVAKSIKGEKFTSLDGSVFELDGSELMIRDAERAIAMAGVVGGQNSGVDSQTTDLFIECANFSPSVVRRASRKHGVQTDAAYRFSRGVDIDAVMFAINRCCEMIQKTAGGEILGNHYDIYPRPHVKIPVELSVNQVSQRLGFQAEKSELESWMKRLGCKVESSKTLEGDGFLITPPSYRSDLEIKEDLIEEYARLKGYEHVPETLPIMAAEPRPHASQYTLSRLISKKLVTEGFYQAQNFAFVSEAAENKTLGDRSRFKPAGLEIASQSVKIRNPLSEELNVMRSSLVTGLLQNVIHNTRYGNSSGRLFEVGHCFEKVDSEFAEDWRLGVVAWGDEQDLWMKNRGPLVLQVKTALENVIRSLNGRNWSWAQLENGPEFLHPAQSASLFYEGKVIGFLGSVHPLWLEENKVKGPAVIAEFDLSHLMQGQPRVQKQKPISKFQPVERDLAFVLSSEVAASELLLAAKKAAGSQLQSVRIFDVYEGAPLEAGTKSLAIRLVYQDQNATMTDEQITALQKKVVDDVCKKLNAQVR